MFKRLNVKFDKPQDGNRSIELAEDIKYYKYIKTYDNKYIGYGK